MPQQLDRLLAIMATLRDPERGCDWDRAQRFETIVPHTIEEAYEVADAIQRQDLDDLRGELGDLLLQVVYHARIAEEAGHFTLEDVAEAICDKMEARHPHIFADGTSPGWETLKAQERAAKGSKSAMDGVAVALPALLRAEKLQKRAARVGFDWDDAAPVFEKLDEEIAELRDAVAAGRAREVEEELGDLLFTVVNLARKLKVDGETALAGSTRKFVSRFRAVEAEIAAQGRRIEDASPEEMNELWERHKAASAA